MPRMLRIAVFVVVLASACGASQPASEPAPQPVPIASPTPPIEPTAIEVPASPIADRYRDVSQRIIEAALADDGAWKKLSHLTDRIGHRLSGSEALERAVEWAGEAMKADGHENVVLEKVMVPHWVRGRESARVVSPARHELSILGLGGSVGTGKKGITAPIIPISTFEELDARAAEVAGKIVLYTHALPAYTEDGGSGYGEGVAFRYDGASRAAAHGAKGVLLRSLTATSLDSPHTGAMAYEKESQQIPAAAVSIEGAELLARLAASGEVQVELSMEAKMLPDAVSYNVLAEIVGSELPNEIVLIGGHIDSWDVGQGAHDDGAGCAIMMGALGVLRNLGLRPRRTIRVVLFTNEENGLRGAKEYAAAHAKEPHVMAIEADSGGFAPVGFSLDGEDPTALAQLVDIVTLLEGIGAGRTEAGGHGGADIGPLARAGVPALGLWVEGSRYFDYHHTNADTLDKVDPEHIKKNVAAVAVMAYVVADMPARFGAK